MSENENLMELQKLEDNLLNKHQYQFLPFRHMCLIDLDVYVFACVGINKYTDAIKVRRNHTHQFMW